MQNSFLGRAAMGADGEGMGTGTGVEMSLTCRERRGRAGFKARRSRATGGPIAKFCASERRSLLWAAGLATAAQVGHSRMAGEHSSPHSGQIQYSICIHSRTKVVLYLSVTHPSFL